MLILAASQWLPAWSAGLAYDRRLPRSSSARCSAAASPFETWAAVSGIEAPKLRITDIAELRGTITEDAIAAGEEFCVVPRTRCLDLAAVSDSPCPSFLTTEQWDRLLWFERLAVWLLAEERLGAESSVAGYIAYLPNRASFADAPLSWSAEELSETAYPPFVAAVREQQERITSLHRLLAGKGVTEEDLGWAVQIVLSRAFSSEIASATARPKRARPKREPPKDAAGVVANLQNRFLKLGDAVFGGGGEEEEQPQMAMALMPMLDAFNHDPQSAQSCSYDPSRNAFVLTAKSALAAGEQAFLSYGPKGNDELLQFFGFVEQENPYDTFLSIGLQEHTLAKAKALFGAGPECTRRLSLLPKLKLGDALIEAELKAAGAPASVWHALRVMVGTPEELEGDLQKLRRPASVATEERAIGILKSYCKLARSAVGGPMKKDLAALRKLGSAAGDSAVVRKQLAIQFRVEKKALLTSLEQKLALAETRNRKAGRVMTDLSV